MRPSTLMIAIAGAAAALMGCSSSNNGPPPASTPTFTEVYNQIISAKCLACHVPGQIGVTSGTLDMSTPTLAYNDLVGVPAGGSACGGLGTRVVAGEPTMSLLYEKVAGTPPCGSRMPLDGVPLSQDEIDEINDWIAGGALNN